MVNMLVAQLKWKAYSICTVLYIIFYIFRGKNEFKMIRIPDDFDRWLCVIIPASKEGVML